MGKKRPQDEGNAPGPDGMPPPPGQEPMPGDMPPKQPGGPILKPAEKKEEFKVEDATFEFILNGEKINTVENVTVSVGGQMSKGEKKLGYNIKCNSGNLFGRKQFRLRPNLEDASLLRTKLSCDVLNRLGMPSISSNYARLYFNGEYMGLYVLMDAFKKSWIKKVFKNDNEVSHLYQCKNAFADFSTNNLILCTNANDDHDGEMDALEDFIETVNTAQSREELEDFMEVDEFVQTWIFEWLTGSWDSSLVTGKNYYLYKQVGDNDKDNGKWMMFAYDFDSTFGHRLQNNAGRFFGDGYDISFDEWHEPRHIVDVLVKSDSTTFITNLQYILDKAFRPDLLFPHIDSLKSWIAPYVKEDRTPVNGTYVGYVNKKSARHDFDPFTYEDFELNSEYTDIGFGIGIKKWIQNRYDYVCANYPVNCPSSTSTSTSASTSISPSISTSTSISPSISTSISTFTPITTITPTSPVEETCWSEVLGYPCCSNTCHVILTDESGSWGAEKGEWCGIPSEKCKNKI